MRNRKTLFYALIAAAIALVGLTPLTVSAGSVMTGDRQVAPQSGPTPTPEDPGWLAFVAARAALEEATGQDLTWVQQWFYEEYQFVDGIDSCRTLEEGEEPRQVYFGWRFLITTLTGQQYEVRTSFNRQIIAVCDEVTAAAPTTTTTNPNLPAPVAGSAVSGSFEIGGQITGLYPNTRDALNRARMKWVGRSLACTPTRATRSTALV